MTITTITILTLATMRIARLIQQDTITERLRECIWMLSPAEEGDSGYRLVPADARPRLSRLAWFNPLNHIEVRYLYHERSTEWRLAGFWGQVIACRSCLSVWAAGGVYALSLTPVLPLLWVLAISEGVIILGDLAYKYTLVEPDERRGF